MSTLKMAVLGTGMMGPCRLAKRSRSSRLEPHPYQGRAAGADGVTIHDNAADAVRDVDFA